MSLRSFLENTSKVFLIFGTDYDLKVSRILKKVRRTTGQINKALSEQELELENNLICVFNPTGREDISDVFQHHVEIFEDDKIDLITPDEVKKCNYSLIICPERCSFQEINSLLENTEKQCFLVTSRKYSKVVFEMLHSNKVNFFTVDFSDSESYNQDIFKVPFKGPYSLSAVIKPRVKRG